MREVWGCVVLREMEGVVRVVRKVLRCVESRSTHPTLITPPHPLTPPSPLTPLTPSTSPPTPPQRMGAHVTILEGRDRVGGRIHSWRMKTGAAATGNDTVAAAGNDDVTRATDGAAMGATDAAAMRAADEAAMRERGTDAATTREPATDAASRSPDAATAPAPNTATAPAAPVPLISPSMVTSTVTVDLGASYICGTSRNPPCNPILEYCVDKLGLEIRPKASGDTVVFYDFI